MDALLATSTPTSSTTTRGAASQREFAPTLPPPDCLYDRHKRTIDLDNLALTLLQKLCKEEARNFVVSPLSLATALGMTALGLRGESKTELLELLKAQDENALHVVFKNLLANKKCPLKISNKMLADRKSALFEDAVTALEINYRCGIDLVDFARDAKEVRRDVNHWIAAKTDDEIPKLLSGKEVKPSDTLIILNAAYFKGYWCYNFKSSWWFQRQWFQLRNGEKVRRSFMSIKRTFAYLETDKLRVVRLIYSEQNFRIILAIPRNTEDVIDQVIAGMSTADLVKLIEEVKYLARFRTISLRMPRFKIEYSHRNVKEHLTQLGLSKLFVEGECDLGELFSKADRDPCVGDIIHKASFGVDLKGTEATMPEGVSIKKPRVSRVSRASRASVEPTETVELFLERPFCFWVVSDSNIVTLTGICADP